MAKKVGRPKVAANEKKVPVTIMVKARHRKELQELFKKLADGKQDTGIDNPQS